MNVFERFQNRFTKSATLAPQTAEKVTPSVDQHQPQQLPPSQHDYSFPATVPAHNVYTEPSAAENYECAEEWTQLRRNSDRPISTDPPPISPEATGCRSGQPVSGDTAHAVSKQIQRKAPNSQPHLRRAKTPISSFYNVSSDDDDDDESDDEDTKEADGEPTKMESAAAFERRSLRIRRSIDKAKAALPADFVDRIGVAPVMSESVYRDRSVTRPPGLRSGAHEIDEAALHPTGDEFNSSDDEAGPTTQVPITDGDYANYPQPSPRNRRSTIQAGSRDSYSEAYDRSASSSSSSKGPSAHMSQSGILWRSEHPQPLEELVARFRTNPPGSAYLTKAISQRSGCPCALCGHDSLLLFPVLDASLALASWSVWSYPSKTHIKPFSTHDRSGGMGSAFATVSESQAKLAVFRQCRGWYEILNENQQAIPHLTTVEQFRRAKPSTFLIRRDLKCLAAPPTLLVPPINDTRSTGEGAPPVPFPSSVVAIATASDTLMNSVPEIIPAGTLMHFVTYLPHCQVKRGRKIKELGLILATKRVPGSPIRRSRSGELSNGNNLPSRAYYIGLEDSAPAVLPSRFSISPVAGPENISGVHSLASVLRKFRLPISVRPVYAPDGGASGSLLTADQAERLSNGSRNSIPNITPFQCGLSAVPGLQFTDRHYLRLFSLCRGDILIFAPITSPERLFLITPSMLRDHVFQLGTASDPAYEQLLEGHRMQSINFLASAHPRDSLNYLVRHMRDVTREPRESYTTRQINRTRSDTARGSISDSSIPPDMTQEEMYQAYDELDDIYFFIRHGYYPSKSRRPETPIKTTENVQFSTSRAVKNSTHVPNQTETYEQTETEQAPRRSDANQAMRNSMPTAEQLLAASLKAPVRNHSFQTRWHNGSGNAASTYRIQPKEYGI